MLECTVFFFFFFFFVRACVDATDTQSASWLCARKYKATPDKHIQTLKASESSEGISPLRAVLKFDKIIRALTQTCEDSQKVNTDFKCFF